ncbi:DMT family transporter [Pasteurella bettyae]|uniref:PF04657 family protein n=1 Tax=Pasteurella bettyae CCUG 2042 TaxID=1095749 RepID=I3DEL8_9PAST|nr:DMT family transporter [Pasteurella bettyae]EIJ70161.1 PF04657 family protein [Pasteurella bettyae CCUG 2042]
METLKLEVLMLLMLLCVIAGCGLSIQTVINSRLRSYVGSPFFASMVSFLVGTFSLILVTFLTGNPFFIDVDIFLNTPWWLWMGGLFGVIALTTNILLFPHLGGVQTVIMPIFGQIIMGILIDSFGWFNAPLISFSWNRGVGLILVLMGIILAVTMSKTRYYPEPQSKSEPNMIWLWRLLGIFAGMLGAMQTAVNGQLGRILHSPLQAALVSFIGGALALLIFVGVKEGRFHRIFETTQKHMPWWLWLGGLLGAAFVFMGVVLMPIVGTGTTVILALLGMISGSLLVDQYGILGAPRKPVYGIQILGLIILFLGVALIRLW